MNEKQSQELEALEALETAGTLEDVQKERYEELKEIKALSEKAKAADSLQVQKEKFREKAEKEEAERKALEAKLNEHIREPGSKAALDVVDYIDISASLDGLDQREKTYLAEQHKLSGKPLKEIREGEDFQLWQNAYRAKQEKERALKPNSQQPVEPPPKSFAERLRDASIAEKEAMLKEAGLYREARPRADRTKIG